MRRTESRPSSEERSDTPPGGDGNGGEGRESFSANAQHGGAAASSNTIADFANALLQALQMTNEGGLTAPTGTYASRPIEIRQNVEMLAWTGKFERGQRVASAFRVFRGSVLSWVSTEGLTDVLKGESIPVGYSGCGPVTTQEFFLWGGESSKVTKALVTTHRKNHSPTSTRNDFCRGLTARSVEGV